MYMYTIHVSDIMIYAGVKNVINMRYIVISLFYSHDHNFHHYHRHHDHHLLINILSVIINIIFSKS